MDKLIIKILLVLALTMPVQYGAYAAGGSADWNGIKDALALKIGSPKAFVRLRQVNIDPDNHRVVPIVKHDRTLLPIRFVSESFGAVVMWDDDTSTATVTYKDQTAKITMNSEHMLVNGKSVELDVTAELINNRIYIPLRRLCEDLLGKKVFYDSDIIVLSDQDNLSVSKTFLDELNGSFKDNIGRLHYMVYYGKLDDAKIAAAKTYDLVILHPYMAELTREQVCQIRQGVDPDDPSDDVTVLGYVSAGEDMRTCSLTDQEFAADLRFKGDGTGPRVDPRGPTPDSGKPLAGIAPAGAASPGGSGFASYYLDDNNRDGIPDKNTYFNGAFVNAGDPAWFETLDYMTMDSPDRLPGLKEILTDNYGRGLGCDGVFLDTIDTCAPNSYTNENSYNQSEFEWTAPGFSAFIDKVRSAYAGKLILQNRGLFFFDPRLPHYQFCTGKSIDYLMFESYRLDANPNEVYSDGFFRDNKYAYMPKIMAEAGRPDGFRVLSLGYAAGDKKPAATLTGQSRQGVDDFLADIRETQEIAGFNHYLTDAAVLLVNDFVRQNSDAVDDTPPVWSSVYNDSPSWPPDAPKPRVGVGQALPGQQSVTLRWDVALDKNKVAYTAYYQTQPFDFDKDPDLTSAEKRILIPQMGEGYQNGVNANTYPYQFDIDGLMPGTCYYFVIRASDTSVRQNQEKNQVVLSAIPLE